MYYFSAKLEPYLLKYITLNVVIFTLINLEQCDKSELYLSNQFLVLFSEFFWG